MAKGLTKTTYEALSLAHEHGAIVMTDRFGGWSYWTYEDCPGHLPWGARSWRPDTSFARPTLRSLLDAGYLREESPERLLVTPEGVRILERTREALRVKAEAREAAVPVPFKMAARVFWQDGTVMHVGVVEAGEDWDGHRLDDQGLILDVVLTATEEEALGQTRGSRRDRIRDAACPVGSERDKHPDWPFPAHMVHVDEGRALVPYDTMEPVVVEVAWTPETWRCEIFGYPGAVWWVVLADRSLGLLAHPEDALKVRKGLFRPKEGSRAPVTGCDWPDVPWGELCMLGPAHDRLEEMAEAARGDPSPAVRKALHLADGDGLERLEGGFWTYPGCPTMHGTGLNPAGVPKEYVDTGTVVACVRRGLLDMGEPLDARACLTDAGRAAMVEDEGATPRP